MPQSVLYDNQDEIWIVFFWKDSDEIIAGRDCSTAGFAGMQGVREEYDILHIGNWGGYGQVTVLSAGDMGGGSALGMDSQAD